MPKYSILFCLLLVTICNLSSLTVPFNDKLIRTNENKISKLVRVVPADSLVSNLKNEIWITHNRKYLIFDIKAEINEALETGRFATEDEWINADYFRIQIVTEEKDYYSYVFYIFPLGSRYDGIRDSDFQIDNNWDSSYFYKTNLDIDNWTSKVYIPFRDLRFVGDPPYNWKLIITRFSADSREYYSVPFLRTNLGKDYFRKALDISISQQINRSINYFFRPYVIANYDIMDEDIKFNEHDIGVDLSLRPNYATNIKFSYNPDYSDVPLDDESDIYNQKYPPTPEENRYFFIEDFNAYGIDNTHFYSRNILQPRYALKVTGNTNNFSYGILSVKDKKTELNHDDLFNIAAIKPTFNKVSLQFTILNRMNKNYSNNVFHLKPEIEIAANKDLYFDLNFSNTNMDASTENGYFFVSGLQLYEEDLNLHIGTQQMSKEFRMDMGRIFQTDFYGWFLNISHKKDLYLYPLKSIDTAVSYNEEIDNSTSKLLEKYLSISASAESFYEITFSPDFYYQRELYKGIYHDTYRAGLRFEWDSLPFLEPKFSWNILESLIYSQGEVHSGYYYQFAVGGDVSKYVSYFISADNIKYVELLKSDSVDDEYWIINGDLDISLTNNFYISSGLGFNNYEYYTFSDHWGIYSNLIWEYKPKSQLILGFRSVQDKINQQLVKDYETLYLKITYSY